MLKRIKPEQVRLGMFVEAVDGDWNGQRFWKSRFRLENLKDVIALKSSGAKAITIDTDAGSDAEPVARVKKAHDLPKSQVEQGLQTINLAKPLVKSMFAEARMGNAVSTQEAMQVVDDITTCMRESARALIAVTRLKTRDEYTFLHSIAVAALMVHLGRALKIEESAIRDLAMGGLLHDIGKMKLPLELLNKTGRLTEEEMRMVREHPRYSEQMVSGKVDIPQVVLDICLHHHERPDGRGYPDRLLCNEISLPVRIATICDVFDALTSRRPYKRAWSANEAATFMLQQEGQFDQPILRTFLSSMGVQFSIGRKCKAS